ncbi:MAG: hypothetical protein FJ206_01780 [Gemmatimonadetes bacterium]|nr:hypothetical protein [Gemmatimonadota bacterium]
MPIRPRLLTSILLAAATAASATAQPPAVAYLTPAEPVIQYSRNESGGRVSLSFPGADSTLLERRRLQLIELTAAIRRGDFRSVWIFPQGHPAVQVLADRRERLRCTFRSTPRGGDLVLLSDDDVVVAAIHQMLAEPPPRAVRL